MARLSEKSRKMLTLVWIPRLDSDFQDMVRITETWLGLPSRFGFQSMSKPDSDYRNWIRIAELIRIPEHAKTWFGLPKLDSDCPVDSDSRTCQNLIRITETGFGLQNIPGFQNNSDSRTARIFTVATRKWINMRGRCRSRVLESS